MLKNKKNTKLQGNVGIGKAIGFFVENGINVAVPLTDSQSYDLIIDEDGKFKSVQVKTVYHKTPSGFFCVELRTRTHAKGKLYGTKSLSKNLDYVFVFTEANEKYLIPRDKIFVKGGLTLNAKFSQFKV